MSLHPEISKAISALGGAAKLELADKQSRAKERADKLLQARDGLLSYLRARENLRHSLTQTLSAMANNKGFEEELSALSISELNTQYRHLISVQAAIAREIVRRDPPEHICS